MNKKRTRDSVASGIFFAGLFLGIGIGGGIYGNYAAGALIGLGAGAIASIIILLARNKKK